MVEPVANGIGSDAFAIVWDGQRLHGLNASGRSPAAWTAEYFGGGGVPALGWNSVTVPGAVSAWSELHAAFGKLPFTRLFEPAIGPGHPNQVGPNKRPYHTIMPGFVTKAGAPVMSFGVMGGAMQPQGHVQLVVRIAQHGQNPQAACDGPRFRWVQGRQVACEAGFPRATLDELCRRGHQLVGVDDYHQFGACQAIWRLDNGYFAASDPRRDGQAAGF